MAHDAAKQELDEDGLIVQRYNSIVLVVVPPEGFGDQILRYARSSLYNVHVGTLSVSTLTDEMVKGRLQDEFLVDAAIADARMENHSGILIAGSEGPENPLVGEARVLELIREAASDGKLIAAWGNAVGVLARAGVIKGRKVTGADSQRRAVAAAGAKFTGRQVEVSANVVTARDEGAGMRFGQALAEVVRI